MAGDYGLSAMTGVLPTIVVAGAATGMVTQLMPGQRRARSRSRRRAPSMFGPPPKGRRKGRTKKDGVFGVLL